MPRVHHRSRSDMSFVELGLYEKIDLDLDLDLDPENGNDAGESTHWPRSCSRQMAVIYTLFLAEAIMASSLQPQLKMLLASDDFCGNLSTSYLRSVLDCAYAFGGVAGLFWGWLSDRVGRRPVALLGLFGMSFCCLAMGFATDLLSCAVFRFLAGLVGSSTAVVTLTMIGDLSPTTFDRAVALSRLPLVALCGSVGPLVQGMVARSSRADGAVWQRYPMLSSQIACGSLVFVIVIVVSLTLAETLPSVARNALLPDDEKAAFLRPGQDDEAGYPSVAVVDSSAPDAMSVGQILRAPSLVILLASFSLLSLHSSSFDALLPHLGHSATHHAGMGIPCDVLGLVVTLVRGVAAVLVLTTVPRLVRHQHLLRPYRVFSLFFPAIYAGTPLLALVASSSAVATAVSSTVSLLFKNALSSTAQVLVALLVLNTSPDASSSGTVVGLMQFASLFKVLAAAVTAATFYLGPDVSVASANAALWAVLVCLSLAGAGLACFVRDHPTLNQDFPADVLRWEMCFDAARHDEGLDHK